MLSANSVTRGGGGGGVYTAGSGIEGPASVIIANIHKDNVLILACELPLFRRHDGLVATWNAFRKIP